jgi:hypothetical protein
MTWLRADLRTTRTYHLQHTIQSFGVTADEFRTFCGEPASQIRYFVPLRKCSTGGHRRSTQYPPPVSINARCVEKVDISCLKIRPYDGRHVPIDNPVVCMSLTATRSGSSPSGVPVPGWRPDPKRPDHAGSPRCISRSSAGTAPNRSSSRRPRKPTRDPDRPFPALSIQGHLRRQVH